VLDIVRPLSLCGYIVDSSHHRVALFFPLPLPIWSCGGAWQWFGPVLSFINRHDVRLWSYINCDWDAFPMWQVIPPASPHTSPEPRSLSLIVVLHQLRLGRLPHVAGDHTHNVLPLARPARRWTVVLGGTSQRSHASPDTSPAPRSLSFPVYLKTGAARPRGGVGGQPRGDAPGPGQEVARRGE